MELGFLSHQCNSIVCQNNYVYDADGTLWPYDIALTFMEWRGVLDEYEEICNLYGNEVCFSWVGGLWVGMTRKQVDVQMKEFVEWAEENQPRVQPFPYMKRQLESNSRSKNWIVSASPTILVKAWVKHIGLPVPQSNIIGVDTVIKNGIYTNQVAEPIPYRDGKVTNIENKVMYPIGQIAGNSLTDYEMLLYGTYKLGSNILVVNPESDPTGCGGYGNLGDLIQPSWKVVYC